jgi:hypothetical protein
MKTSTGLVLPSVDEPLEHTQNTLNRIARRAFEIFESRGGLHGHDREDWFLAETELFEPVKLPISGSGEPVTVSAEAKPGASRRLLQEPMRRSSRRKQYR